MRTLPKLRIHINPLSGCWEWIGTRNDDGYGVVNTSDGTSLAHRAVWTVLVGPIGEGMHLDHLCRFRSCVNPTHLEEVPPPENIARMLDVRHPGTVHSRDGAPTVPSILLEDVQQAFGGADRLHGIDLLAALPERYSDWDQLRLARELREFGVAPLQLWLHGRNRQGYKAAAVRAARKRHQAAQRRAVAPIDPGSLGPEVDETYRHR